MAIAKQSLVASEVKEALHALRGDARDYDPLLKLVSGARFCLLGEATHGTHEFYRERAEITKRLIKEQGFTAVAVEADWPDVFRSHLDRSGDKARRACKPCDQRTDRCLA